MHLLCEAYDLIRLKEALNLLTCKMYFPCDYLYELNVSIKFHKKTEPEQYNTTFKYSRKKRNPS